MTIFQNAVVILIDSRYPESPKEKGKTKGKLEIEFYRMDPRFSAVYFNQSHSLPIFLRGPRARQHGSITGLLPDPVSMII